MKRWEDYAAEFPGTGDDNNVYFDFSPNYLARGNATQIREVLGPSLQIFLVAKSGAEQFCYPAFRNRNHVSRFKACLANPPLPRPPAEVLTQFGATHRKVSTHRRTAAQQRPTNVCGLTPLDSLQLQEFCYVEKLERWRRLFPLRQFTLLSYDRVADGSMTPQDMVDRISDKAGVPRYKLPPELLACVLCASAGVADTPQLTVPTECF